MKTYTQDQLKEIIAKHQLWLDDEEGGERANLSSANLCSANLSSADLSYANLRYADLRSAANILCVGNKANIKTVQADIWPVAYTCDEMQIGCQRHAIAEWWAFGDDEISRMDSRALGWWKVWKPILQAMIQASPAEPTGYVEKEGDAE